jgi:hypothetical protein
MLKGWIYLWFCKETRIRVKTALYCWLAGAQATAVIRNQKCQAHVSMQNTHTECDCVIY